MYRVLDESSEVPLEVLEYICKEHFICWSTSMRDFTAEKIDEKGRALALAHSREKNVILRQIHAPVPPVPNKSLLRYPYVLIWEPLIKLARTLARAPPDVATPRPKRLRLHQSIPAKPSPM